MNRWLILVFLTIISFPLFSYSKEESLLFRDDFNNIDNWKPLYFPKIKKHTIYSVISDGDNRYLRTESNGSASALIYQNEFNVYDYPNVRWRWKTDNIFQKGDPLIKAGDDYPLRIYIAFKYDPSLAAFSERLIYNSVKLLYGEYPPLSSLNYIWSSKENNARILVSPYTERSQMILLQQGSSNIGKWMNEEINIIKDYRSAFGKEPPPLATIGIMNDSDNTGEKAVSYMDFIEVSK